MRLLLGLILFLLDLYALARLYGTPLPRSRKLAWTATILFIPFAGAVLWLRSGHASNRRAIAS